MPYSKIADLPGSVRNLPKAGQEIWLAAFNSAYDEYEGDEEKANATAWQAVKDAGYEKSGDKWVKAEAAKPAAPEFVSVAEAGLSVARVEEFDTAGTTETADRYEVRVVEDAKTDAAKGDYHIVVIEAGRNEAKRRVYTNAALESLPTEPYTGLQMFLDHDAAEGAAVGVRPVDRLASVITKSWTVKAGESGSTAAAVHAIAHVFPAAPHGFAENMRDPLFRKSVFTSHVADLRGYVGREAGDGGNWQIVTEIPKRHGVDWVTKPGARGRVAESAKHETGADAPEETTVNWETITRESLAEHRPDLVKEIAETEVAAFKATVTEEDATAKLQSDLAAAEAARQAAESRLRNIEIAGAVKEAVSAEGSGIPDAVREKVVQRVAAQVVTLPPDKLAGDTLKTTVAEAVKAEAGFLSDAVGKPVIDLAAGAGRQGASPIEELQKRAEAILGVKP